MDDAYNALDGAKLGVWTYLKGELLEAHSYLPEREEAGAALLRILAYRMEMHYGVPMERIGNGLITEAERIRKMMQSRPTYTMPVPEGHDTWLPFVEESNE